MIKKSMITIKKIKKDKIVTYKLKFIDSYRFMQDSLSNLVDNLSKINDKEHENKFVDTMGFMMDSLSHSINKYHRFIENITKLQKRTR